MIFFKRKKRYFYAVCSVKTEYGLSGDAYLFITNSKGRFPAAEWIREGVAKEKGFEPRNVVVTNIIELDERDFADLRSIKNDAG
jgi:hypothetical protein